MWMRRRFQSSLCAFLECIACSRHNMTAVTQGAEAADIYFLAPCCIMVQTARTAASEFIKEKQYNLQSDFCTASFSILRLFRPKCLGATGFVDQLFCNIFLQVFLSARANWIPALKNLHRRWTQSTRQTALQGQCNKEHAVHATMWFLTAHENDSPC